MTKRKPYGFYSDKTDRELIDYGEGQGYDKLTRTDLSKENSGYYEECRKRKIVEKLIPETKRKPRGFYSKKTDEELIEYGMGWEYDKLTRKELGKENVSYYKECLERKIVEKLIPETKVKPSGFYKNKSVKELIDYGIEQGYDKLTRNGLKKEDGGYYLECWKRKLLDKLISERSNSIKQVLDGMLNDYIQGGK